MLISQCPLLEYDGAQEAVIDPGREQEELRLPSRAVLAFVAGELVDAFAASRGMEKAAEFLTVTKRFPLYTGQEQGQSFVLCPAPLGAPAAVQILDWLLAHGVETVLATGSCGVLTELPENVFLIPVRALRDEGTSFHYLPAARFVETDPALRQVMKQVFQEKGLPYVECDTWTTDGFFRETRQKVAARRSEGCACVEMECAALAACAKFRGAAFAQILFTADSLAHLEAHDPRDWGNAAQAPALALCVEIIGSCREGAAS